MNVRPIKGFDTFSSAFRAGRRGARGPLLMSVVTQGAASTADPDVVFIGVGVSKRVAKKAVVRSRIRRLLRAALRDSLERQSHLVRTCHVVTVIATMREAPPRPSLISLADVQRLVDHLLIRILSECPTPNSADPQ